MTDKLVFEADLDNTPILRAFEKVRAEALAIDKVMAELGRGTDLQAAMAQLATAATSSMQVVRQQIKTLDTSVKELQGRLRDQAQQAVAEVAKVTKAAQAEIAGHYDALGNFISTAAAKATTAADAANRRMLLLSPAEASAATAQAKGVLAGHYDALGSFIPQAAAGAAAAAELANRRALLLDTGTVRAATAQSKAEVVVHYDALGRVISTEALRTAEAATAANRRMLMLDTGAVRAATAQSKVAVVVHYDALGRVINTESAKVADTAAAANRRMLMLDTGAVRAATAQAQREIKVHYDALGRVITEGAAKAAASADVASKRALMLNTGEIRTATSQTTSLHTESAKLATMSATLADTFGRQALNAKDLHSAYRGLASGFGAMWLTWGAALPLLTGAAISSGVVQVVKQGAQVDQALQTIRVLSQESGEAVSGLRVQLLELARSGPFGPLEVAEAMKTLSLAGLSAEQVAASIKDVMNLAVAGTTSLTQAADVMVSVGTAFGIAAEGYNYIGDVIAKTAAVSKASVESVGEAFKTASVLHKQYGTSLEDVGVGLAALSNLGIQGSAAGTALRNMYADLSGRSEKAAGALKKFNLDLRDQYGGFKDVITIAQQFDAVLSKMDPKAAKDYIHTVFSERGAKPFIEILDQARKDVQTAKDAGDQLATVYSKLEELRDKISNSAGFAAISAAQMAMTPLNQMKSVAASLQASLVEAFESVSPTIVAVGEQLRAVFSSDEFKSAIKNLVLSVAELTKFLVENFDAIVALGKAYLAFKVAQGVGNIFGLLAQGAASSAAAVGTLAAALPQAHNAFSGLGVAAAGTATTVGGMATALTGVARWIPVVGAVVQVAAGAWALYELYSSKAKSSQDALAGSTSSETYIAKLRAETDRLNENTEALLKNISVADLRANKEKTAAMESAESESVKKLADAERSVLQAKQEVAKFDEQNKVVSGSNAKYRELLVNQVAKAEVGLGQVREAQYIASRDRQEWEARAMSAAARQADAVRAKLEADKKAAAGTFGGIKFDPSEANKHATAMKTFRSNDLAQTEKFYASELSLLDKYSANAQARLKDALSSGLIDKGEYMARELLMTEGFEKQKLDLLEAQRAAYETAYRDGILKQLENYEEWVKKHQGEKGFAERQAETLRSLEQGFTNSLRAAETFFEKNDNEKAKVQDNALTRMYKQAVDLQGAIKKLATDTREFWASEEVLTKKAATQTSVEDALRYASPESAAYISAAAKETERLTDRVYDYDKQIRLATLSLEAFVEAMGDDANWTDTTTAAYNSQKAALAALGAERSKLLSVIPDRAAEKGKQAVEKYWKDWEADLVKGLTGAVMVGLFDGGKSGAKALRALIVAKLREPIQVVVQALVKPIIGAISGAFGVGNAAAGTGGSLLSSSAIGSGLFGAAGVAGLGSAMGSSFGAAFGSTLTGSMGAALEGGVALLGMEGGLMTGLSTIAGALGPISLTLAGVYLLAKKLDKSGTPHTGGGAMYSASGGLQTQGLANGWSGGGAYLTDFGGFKVTEDATKMASGIAQSVVGLLDSAASTFGQQAGYVAATAFADDSSSDGAWGALAIKLGDKMVAEWGQWANGPGGTTFSDGEAGSAEYLAKISSDVRTVLNGIDMPDWAKKVLNDLPDGATLQQMGDAVAAINKTQTAWERLGKTLSGFGAMSDEAKIKLTSASGGIDALVTNASAYYDNFYTEGERTAATLGSIKTAFDAVAVPMPATREAFRTLVESLEATADTNPYASAALATVLSMAGAFASVVPAAAAAEDATDTLVDTVEEVATLGQELDALRNPVRSIKDVAQGIFSLEKEGASLQVELWRTYGDSNSLLAANKLARDIETAGMTEQEVAQYDLNASRRAEIDTIHAQRQAHADAVASWQTYFDLVATPQEKQTRARAIVQAVLPADVDTLQEYKDYVWGLTVQFGLGSAEMKAATDVAQQFAVAFPEVAQEIAEVSAASTVLTKDLSAFRAGFFTTAEQTALATQDMTASLQALGLTTLPTSNAEFRALALGIDTSTESGKLLFNGLMGLAGGFAQLYPLVTSVTEVVATLDSAIASLRASGASRTVDQIAGNMLTLEEQIFELQNAGNTAALRQHKLDGLSDVKDSVTGLSERDLQNMVWSLQDSAQAALDLAAANKIAEDEATRAADAIATEAQRAADAAAAAAQKIASEHDGLWRQWLTATGDTAALRALDLAALDPSNRALQEQIWALEDQKKAAEEATSAAEQMKSAWGSLTDSMIDEVRRIRGLMDESSGAGYASLASQFAIATAQTRAGDQAAAQLLPGLSQSMLTAYEASATSLVDLQRVRALTANSLEQTASLLGASPQALASTHSNGTVTGTATGTVINSYAPAAVTAPGPSLTDVVTELRAEIAALKDELKGMRGEAKATSETIAINTGKTARLNQKWDDVGLPITTETDLAAVYGA